MNINCLHKQYTTRPPSKKKNTQGVQPTRRHASLETSRRPQGSLNRLQDGVSHPTTDGLARKRKMARWLRTMMNCAASEQEHLQELPPRKTPASPMVREAWARKRGAGTQTSVSPSTTNRQIARALREK
ncbi:hypothetical protein BaRGS_00030997 [Batillaria attramentaria]|uniref:Uncharacterized protein n=1 Tax=Batillaria attramentaria TaxID=370345 RepID=A0ABD0JS41_9CAEN